MISTFEDKENLEFNEKFAFCYDLLENGTQNIFVTGKAGTGKSTLLQYFREHTTKKIVVLAPTGVAAVNIKGQTIHSFFCFRPDITPENVFSIRLQRTQKRMYESLDAIVIDEISMVRADLLDCIDAFLKVYGKKKNEPFGGVQMILFGDLYQLPPVVTSREQSIFTDVYPSPFFFDSKSYQALHLKIIELDKIYRQKDEEFIQLLGGIRNKTFTRWDMVVLNQRLKPDFKIPEGEYYISLTTTNAIADGINQEQLQKLTAVECEHEGLLTGDFQQKDLPTHLNLKLKEGAQVMMLNNDPQGRWINGSIGKLTYLNPDGLGEDAIEVALHNGEVVEVKPVTWEIFHFHYNEESQSIDSDVVGSFTQFPIKLAWAVTIHKSQGKTFDKVIVDIGRGTFSHGQVYVALSRCTTLEGVILRKPIYDHHVLLDQRVVEFMAQNQCS
ncbi:MAG: AAA family ATPase [Candidatus Omnitrophica bacterium]|nr:AAA family ATPase [Candidatus Omnitrophota bacterium]